MPTNAAVVFISYSHDSNEHRGRVLALAQRLRRDGVHCTIDQFVHGSPPEGWPLWMERRIASADFVLVVCTEVYLRRYEGREEPKKGRGVTWESVLARQELYENGPNNTKFVAVMFDGASEGDIPKPLRQHTPYRMDGGYDDLLRYVTNQPAVIPDPIGPPKRLPPVPSAPTDQQRTLAGGDGRPDPHVLASRVPSFPSDEIRALSGRLEDARARRKNLQQAGMSTHRADQTILALRRQIREGGQLQAGDTLGEGRYLLLDIVGRGGFAFVWKAFDRTEQRDVAIKVLHSSLAGDQVRRERFFRGARAMMRLSHPGVVKVLENNGEDGGFYYFVMEFLAGGNLREAILAGRFDRARVWPLVLEVGDAIAAAHRNGLVHRDIKPANVVLSEKGEPKITDFDLVSAHDTTGGTRTSALGTIVYTAPECLEKPAEATVRADVFGLGMTALFCLSGKELSLATFRNPQPTIDNLDCSTRLREVLGRSVAWDPAERFPDAGAMAAAIRDALSSVDSEGDKPGSLPPGDAAGARSGNPDERSGERAKAEAQAKAEVQTEMQPEDEAAASLTVVASSDSARPWNSGRRPPFVQSGRARDGATGGHATMIANLAMEVVYAWCSKRPQFPDLSRLEAYYHSDDRVFSTVGVHLLDPRDAHGHTLWYQVFFERDMPVSILATKEIAAEMFGLPGSYVEVALVSGRPVPTIRSGAEGDAPPTPWAVESGRDQYGVWADLEVGGVRQRMRWIPPGRFLMGAQETEHGYVPNEGPQHEVKLTHGYWLGATPVTQALWGAAMATNPSRFAGNKQRPVECVSWDDCQAFLAQLNAKVAELGARLPTEAEWERACRGGRQGPPREDELSWDAGVLKARELHAIAWYNDNSGGTTHAVAGKAASPYGLYDILGNVWEWCADTGARAYFAGSVTDPVEKSYDSKRVSRGGSWRSTQKEARAACRPTYERTARAPYLGFRLAGGQVPPASELQSGER